MDETETPIEAAWERIDEWLMENAAMTLLTLNGGATDKDFWAAEAALGFQLPAEIRESYRIHDGQPEGVLMNGARFLSLADMGRTYQEFYAAPASWDARWLPLTINESGDAACLDLSVQSRTNGSVLSFLHDEGISGVVAASFTRWLERFADALEANDYVWSSDYDGLMRRDELDK